MITEARHRVLLVGPWRADRPGGGGCCSAGPEAIGAQQPATDEVGHDRACAASVLAALRNDAPEDEIELVDPRNAGYLVPVVVRDGRRRGDGWVTAIRAAVAATTSWALVVDGRVVSRGTPLSPDDAVAAATLARR